MTLQAHPFAIAMELREIGVDRQARALCLLPIADGPVEDAFVRPAHEGITKQRCDVVGDRPAHRILKVQHAGVGRGDHQVARHVVAVNKDGWLRKIRRDDNFEDLCQ